MAEFRPGSVRNRALPGPSTRRHAPMTMRANPDRSNPAWCFDCGATRQNTPLPPSCPRLPWRAQGSRVDRVGTPTELSNLQSLYTYVIETAVTYRVVEFAVALYISCQICTRTQSRSTQLHQSDSYINSMHCNIYKTMHVTNHFQVQETETHHQH